MWIQQCNLLQLYELAAGEDINIGVRGDLTIEALIGTSYSEKEKQERVRNSFGRMVSRGAGEMVRDEDNFVSTLTNKSSISARNFTVISMGDTTLNGVNGDIENDMDIMSMGDTEIGSNRVHSKEYLYSDPENYLHNETVVNVGSNFNVGGDIDIETNNLMVIGSELNAESNVDIDAVNTYIAASQDNYYRAIAYEKSGFFTSESVTDITNNTTSNSSAIRGQNVSINSSNSVVLAGADIEGESINIDTNVLDVNFAVESFHRILNSHKDNGAIATIISLNDKNEEFVQNNILGEDVNINATRIDVEQEATYKEEYVVTDPEERVRLEEIVESGKTVKYKNVMSPNGNSTTEKKYYRYNKEAKEARRKLNAKHEVVEYKDFAVIFGENGANINGNKVHEIGEAETFVDVFNTVYLEEDDQYDYKKQKMMGKLASIAVAIAATALTGGAGAALFGTVGTGALVAGAAVNGMISAAIPQLINKAIDSQNDIDVGSIIKSVAIAGMTYGFDKARLTGDVSKADGWAKAGVAMKNATFNAGLNSLANGTDFDDEFKSSLVADLAKLGANWIGDNYEGKTGNPDALFNGFTHKLAHGVLGCAGGYAATGNSSGCESGAVGGFMGELMAEGVAYATASEGQNALETNRFADVNGNKTGLGKVVKALGQLGAVATAEAMDLDTDIANRYASNAIENNFLTRPQIKTRGEKLKELVDKFKGCGDDETCKKNVSAEYDEIEKQYEKLSKKQQSEQESKLYKDRGVSKENAEFIDSFIEDLVESEDLVGHMYLDTVNERTIGTGNLIDSPEEYLNDLMLYGSQDNQFVTEEQRKETLDRFPTENNNYGQNYYEKYNEISFPDHDIIEQIYAYNDKTLDFESSNYAVQEENHAKYLAKEHLISNVNSIKDEFPDFNAYPLPAQKLLVDMRYNMGSRFNEDKWPSLYKNIKNQDWQEAAGEIDSNAGSQRNKMRREWLIEAQRIKDKSN